MLSVYRLRRHSLGCLAVALISFVPMPAAAVEPPRMLDPAWQIELVATEPQLVTPTGLCFDDAGRLLVVECHTHFPPEDYQGPKQDRIYRFDDSDGDGRLDDQQLFYEGGSATMGLALLPDGWIAVATRSEVVRIRDRDGDGRAEDQQLLLRLQTPATYPHNGLTGIVLGNDGWLYVGQGENLGEPYQLIAADESVQHGGGEGGNVFRCRPDGSELQRVATGFWNPFGMFFDQVDRLWAVGNDPDASPPCRLLHVVPTGDYGFQFRFGRAGIHPLQSWDGEFPGTLPMVAGTGEAPCAVLAVGDQLWVTSWGDNRIERYQVTPDGASWNSQTEVVVQGDSQFRPVGMVRGPDGSLWITDWVDRSYPVHGHGRLWRLSRKSAAASTDAALPALTSAEQAARRISDGDDVAAADRLAATADDDPFVRQAAIAGLVRSGQLASLDCQQAKSAHSRVALITAWRWTELATPEKVSADQRNDWIGWGLQDSDESVVLAALRWATERDSKQWLPAVRELLDRPSLSPQLFSAVIAAVAYLETGSAAGGRRDPAIEAQLIAFASDPNRATKLRALALQTLPSESDQPADSQLAAWATQPNQRSLAREAVALLTARPTAGAMQALATIAASEQADGQTRADAIAALAHDHGQHTELLQRLADGPATQDPSVQEARRVLAARHTVPDPTRPSPQDTDAWDRLVGDGGDPQAGRRVFFRTTCSHCHAHSGRGANTGPDLTTLSGTFTRQRLLESILQPSKEIGPLYVPWQVLTVDGRVLTGLKVGEAAGGSRVRFQGADGKTFEVPLEQIEQQGPTDQSIMPTGLQDAMTIDELRDLVAFLLGQ